MSWIQRATGFAVLLFPFVGTWLQLLAILAAVALFGGDGEPGAHGITHFVLLITHFVLLTGIGPAMLMLVRLAIEWQSKDANRI